MTALSMGLLLLVMAAFVVLDGIGRGSVLRAVTGTAGRPRDEIMAAAGPQLLLGHVWLIATAGLLVGLFPRWEAAVVSHAYWWVLAIAAGLVLRVAAIGPGALGVRRAPGAVHTTLAATGALATAAGTGGFLAAAAGLWPVLGAVAVVALDLVLAGWWLGTTPARRALPLGTVLTLAVLAPIVARWPGLAVPGAGTVPVTELATGPVGAALITGVAGPVFVLVLLVQLWFWRGMRGHRRAAPVRG